MYPSWASLLSLIFLLLLRPFAAINTSDISAVVVLGDSLYDVGNNNDLPSPSIAKAGHFPYGIDYIPATGRFTNGLTAPDLLARSLGKAFPIAYRNPNANGVNLTRGINLASGGAGIRESTSLLLTPYTFAVQLSWLDDYIRKLRSLEGNTSRVPKALVTIAVGSNDFSQRANNNELNSISDDALISLLVDTFENHTRAIYNKGFRRILISAVGPLGCTPLQVTLRCASAFQFFNCDRTICNEDLNELVFRFDIALGTRLQTLRNTLSGVKIIYSTGVFNLTRNIAKNPTSFGFTRGTTGCCGTGLVEIGDYCRFPCLNRKMVFFDAVHPSTMLFEMYNEDTLTAIRNADKLGKSCFSLASR